VNVLLRAACCGIAVLACAGASAASLPPVAARNGMVATSQRLATEVGVDILKKGGNAIDAAVAVGYALGVVLPAAGTSAAGAS
jgi:gamma-glutamyltranspeptidase/glutathione hydrolase